MKKIRMKTLSQRNFRLPLFLFIFSCILFNVHAQDRPSEELWRTYNNPGEGVTFEDLQKSFKAYWQDREYSKGKGYKQFKRWESETAPRIFPSGDMTLTSSTHQKYIDWQNNSTNRSRSTYIGPTWNELGPMSRVTGFDSGNGRLNMLRVDPIDTLTLYVGAPNGGLWKSTNGGNSWSTQTDYLSVIGVSDLAIDPTNTDIMYLATGDIEGDSRSLGVLKSIDGGDSWNTTSLVWSAADDQKISKLLMDPNDPDRMLASTNQGVFRTTDGWDSWTSTSLSVSLQDMEYKPGNTNVVYASGTEFYKSTDNGVSFTKITSGIPATDVTRIVIAVSADDPTVVYAFIGRSSNGGFRGFYRSDNSGNSFFTQSTSPNVLGYEADGLDAGGQAFYDMALTVSPVDVDFVTVGGVNQWQSDDGGVSWYTISHWFGEGGNPYVHADVHEIVHLEANPTTMYTCCDGGLYRSYNEGFDWEDISNNLAISQINSIGHSASTSNRMFCGLQDIGTIETDDVTVWNVSEGGGGDGEDCFMDRFDDDYVVVSGTNGNHELSTDGGLNWDPITSGMPSGDGNAEFFSAIRQHPVLGDTYLAGGREFFYRSNDNGSNWYSSVEDPFFGDPVKEFIISIDDTSVVYATSGFDMAVSYDSGDTWTDISAGLPTSLASISKIAVADNDVDKVWVTFSGYDADSKVFKSINGGTTWTNISAGLPNIPINTIVYEEGSAADNIYIGADIGVYFINNVTPSWIPHSNGLANVSIRDLRIYYSSTPAKLRAATYGRGAWEVDVRTTICENLISEVCVSGPCLFASGLYQAQNTINFNGDFSIENFNQVIFSAGNGSTIDSGFGVELGSEFEMNATGCSP